MTGTESYGQMTDIGLEQVHDQAYAANTDAYNHMTATPYPSAAYDAYKATFDSSAAVQRAAAAELARRLAERTADNDDRQARAHADAAQAAAEQPQDGPGRYQAALDRMDRADRQWITAHAEAARLEQESEAEVDAARASLRSMEARPGVPLPEYAPAGGSADSQV